MIDANIRDCMFIRVLLQLDAVLEQHLVAH